MSKPTAWKLIYDSGNVAYVDSARFGEIRRLGWKVGENAIPLVKAGELERLREAAQRVVELWPRDLLYDDTEQGAAMNELRALTIHGSSATCCGSGGNVGRERSGTIPASP